jgi:transposase
VPEITKKRHRTDEVDAANLAHFALVSPTTLHPVQLRPSKQQSALLVIRTRSGLVESRTKLINMVRGLVKLSGDRVAKCDADVFAERAMEQLPASLSETLSPAIQTIRHITTKIAECDKVIAEMADRDYPESRYLWQVPGVGKLTALVYLLTIGSPDRVARSRDVGPLLGLVPARRQSGQKDPHLGISKTGDRYLRMLLVQCAQRILGKRGVDSSLRQWGLAHAGRTRPMKKRAVVAVARKLAVMLHRLWARHEAYRPFPSTDAPPAEARRVA